MLDGMMSSGPTGTGQTPVKGRTTMKTAIHTIALIACFATYAGASGEEPVSGMRRAIQTFSAVQAPAAPTGDLAVDPLSD